MKAMQSLVKVPEIQATMRELSKEMTKVSRASNGSSEFLHCMVFAKNTSFCISVTSVRSTHSETIKHWYVLLLGWHHRGNARRHV